jgi:hypothetical protein
VFHLPATPNLAKAGVHLWQKFCAVLGPVAPGPQVKASQGKSSLVQPFFGEKNYFVPVSFSLNTAIVLAVNDNVDT